MRASKPKSKPVRDAVFYAEWNRNHDHCQLCGVPDHAAPHEPDNGGIGLSTHHMVKSGRSDEACNLLRLCQRCHSLAEGHAIRQGGTLLPRVTIGMCLEAKRLREPDDYDEARLEALRGFPLPEREPIPEFARRAYCIWRHSGECQCGYG